MGSRIAAADTNRGMTEKNADDLRIRVNEIHDAEHALELIGQRDVQEHVHDTTALLPGDVNNLLADVGAIRGSATLDQRDVVDEPAELLQFRSEHGPQRGIAQRAKSLGKRRIEHLA